MNRDDEVTWVDRETRSLSHGIEAVPGRRGPLLKEVQPR